MKLAHLVALAVLVIAEPAAAQWQTPNHSVPMGRGTGKTGFGNAPPSATGYPIVSNGPSADASFRPLPNAGIAPGPANTMKGSLNGTTESDVAIIACSLTYQITKWVSGTGWQCGYTPVLPTRTVAATLNLAGYTAITTQGWGTAGDGGEATFKNVGASPFIDTTITTGSITAPGSGCTNTTYFGVQLSGGTGSLAEATVIAVGGHVTSVTLTGSSSGYTIGDVLSGSITGCTFTWTVATLTAPTGSFTDTAGTHFQIVMPAIGIDMRAFGVKFDYTQAGGDATAADNFTTITNVYNFAGAERSGIFARGGTQGGRVLMPYGTAMYCGASGAKALTQPYGVTVKGQGNFASALKPCDTWSTATHMYELCNSQSHLACFQTMFEEAQIFVSINQETGANVSTMATVYSNNCQQENCGLRNALIFSSACRQAYKLEVGYGGASSLYAADGVSFIGGKSNANCGGNEAAMMTINFGSTQVYMTGVSFSALSASFGGPRSVGLAISGGFVETHNMIAEEVISPLVVNIAGGLDKGMVTVQGFEGDEGCVWFATLSGTNTPGNFSVQGPMAVNSCTGGLVLNGQALGTNMTSPQVLPKDFNP